MEAVCENLPAGEYTITVKLKGCVASSTASDPETWNGFYDGARMHIEEIRSNQRLDAGKQIIHCSVHVCMSMKASIMHGYYMGGII